MNIKNEVCFDKILAEYFKDYFTSIVSSLVEKLPPCSGRFGDADIIDLYHNRKGVGADELSICWFRSYLTGRLQVTDVDGTMYEVKGITCDVPQCSILGRL